MSVSKTSFTDFFTEHPAWIPSLCILTGLGFSFYPSVSFLLLWLALSFLLRAEPGRYAVFCCLTLLAFCYGQNVKPKIPPGIDTLQGTALFSPSALQVKTFRGKPSYSLKGTILSMENTAYNIPCFLSIDSPEIPRSPYRITGTLRKKEDRFVFTQDSPGEKGKEFPISLHTLRFRIKRFLKEKIGQAYRDPVTARFFAGITLGELDDPLLRFAFNKTGLQHILAVSGFHFSLLAGYFCYGLRRIFSERGVYIGLLILLTLYRTLLNDSASVTRAYLAAILYLIGKLAGYTPKPINLLGFVLGSELLLDPLRILDPGFALSFLATGAILLLFSPVSEFVKKWFCSRSEPDFLNFSLLDKITYIAMILLRPVFAVNLAVSLVVTPVCLLFFGSFPILGIFYNLFVPFLVGIGMILFLIALPFEFLCPPLASWIKYCNESLSGRMLRMLIESPNAWDVSLRLPELSSEITSAYLLILFSLAIRYRKALSISSRNGRYVYFST